MVRKRRTDAPSEGGEGSGSREGGVSREGGSGSGGGGRGNSQRGGGQQHQGGQVYNPQQGGRGVGGGGGRGYGQPPPQQQQQQQFGGPQEYQGGRGRGGPPQQRGRGGYGSGRGGGPSAGPPPQRQSVPELHQATSPNYQVVSSQPTPSEVSPTQLPDPPVLAQQFEQLSVEQGSTSHEIQPIPTSSKNYKFPMRPGKGSVGKVA